MRNEIDPDTRTARARIDVHNPDRALKPGMFANVVVSDPHGVDGALSPKTLVVPMGAIQRDGKEQVAFVPKGERRFERRVLTLGQQTDAYAEVLSGLKASDSVVIEGTFILKSEAAKNTLGGGHDD
ncbi:MAG: efflux RND transporter periplasmic adaptor subunit [Myxococcales bacterium]|nr:MAG: efflux RND transporter periplasmic adaptor subunit [Myxococcales bacterium]